MMSCLLGDEFSEFQAVLSRPPFLGLRVNTLKITPERLKQRLPFNLLPLSWTSTGFLISLEAKSGVPTPGKLPEHAAGLYYLQEPSAMLAAEALQPLPGESVLDLCAAPGGKATHLVSLMDNRGLLIANETHPKRVWELAENLERWGAGNTAITQETPIRLAERFKGFFDRILVDAPCSGEGMFRKSEPARRDWNTNLVANCTARQMSILTSAVQMLKMGGRLVYSTCTFNPSENESVIGRLLDDVPDLEVIAAEHLSGHAPARPEWAFPALRRQELSRALRIWPHQAPGEGHFVALLQRKENSEGVYVQSDHTQIASRSFERRLSTPALRSLRSFWDEHIKTEMTPEYLEDEGRLAQIGSYVYLIPRHLPDLSGLRLIHPGLWLGTFHPSERGKTVRFEPAHALAMSLRTDQVQQAQILEANSRELIAYLRGETLNRSGADGWILISVDDYPIGWGKSVSGKVKNFYPRGLRLP